MGTGLAWFCWVLPVLEIEVLLGPACPVKPGRVLLGPVEWLKLRSCWFLEIGVPPGPVLGTGLAWFCCFLSALEIDSCSKALLGLAGPAGPGWVLLGSVEWWKLRGLLLGQAGPVGPGWVVFDLA